MNDYLGIIVIVVVVALLAAGGMFFLFRPGGKAVPPPAEPPEVKPAPEPQVKPPAPEEEGSTTTVPPPVKPAETVIKAPELEVPPPSAGRMVRLRSRLARSQSALGKGLLELLSRDRLDDEVWDEIEESLITADVGVAPTQAMVEELRTKVKVLGTRTPEEVRGLLREELLKQIDPNLDRTLHVAKHGERPAVVLVVGVNGTGKTTTTGKLARSLVGDGKKVVLGAADTFRAAAADQLQTWGDRVGAEVVRGPEGGDPASVAFDATAKGIEDKVDVVIVDTAGRLHTKTGLMDELGKVKRVIEKKATVDEVLLVLDATTGQNGMRQAQVFAEVVNITGIALTKLDGTAKGGIVISVQRELGVPVKLAGLGEGPDDLAPFDPEVFVDAILGD
ncbi:signal recognition particle-docking protein FtsY [Nonomuraea dietziae]|uniref:Signal recognition particle receptor FtsY n=2 Tax=Nonomuraea dietziae TaxID=65515 RepID=A0A7W5YTM1_9ACTN|nr:signal recognition particle-docking protein FtsY [Nonomuraea dietziae]MBB3731019.1 fused signal recognition particle receptor [Nonomuraea dietziae]